jgi:hypothetical protein
MELKGQSLFEVLFTVAIAAIILTGVVSLAVTSLRNTSLSENDARATKYAQEANEWLREERDNDWDVFLTRAQDSNVYCLDDAVLDAASWGNPSSCGAADTIGGNTIFIREVFLSCLEYSPPGFQSVDCSNPNVVNIQTDVEVKWQDAQGTREVKNISRFTNWN